MSIRFPDLQVLFPRTTEAPKAHSGADQANQIHAHAQGIEIAHEKERRNSAIAEAEGSERAQIRRRQGDGGRSRRERAPKQKRSPGEERGRHVDIEA